MYVVLFSVDGGAAVSCVIDSASQQWISASSKRLSHPAGFFLPFDSETDTSRIVPEVRNKLFRCIRHRDGTPVECT